MSVYFLRQGDRGPIKIGHSTDPPERVRQLQTGNHERLQLLAVVPGEKAAEAEVHRLFAAQRMTATEWFRPTEQLLGFIDGLNFLMGTGYEPTSLKSAPSPKACGPERSEAVFAQILNGAAEVVAATLPCAVVPLRHRAQ